MTSGLAGTFGTMTALLAPYMDRQIYEVMSSLARLEDVEMKRKEHSTQVQASWPDALPDWPVQGRSCGQKGGVEQHSSQSAMRVSHRHMWFDLLMVGVAAEKTEQQPNEVLLVLWNQLSSNCLLYTSPSPRD